MSPGDPTEPLPCDDALQGLRSLRAEFAESMAGFLAQVDRRIESLQSCRSHCRVRGQAQEPST